MDAGAGARIEVREIGGSDGGPLAEVRKSASRKWEVGFRAVIEVALQAPCSITWGSCTVKLSNTYLYFVDTGLEAYVLSIS